ncbi:MAG: hypothetical protein ACE5H4_09025 [Candidatus Thorarchaeota archaeon]
MDATSEYGRSIALFLYASQSGLQNASLIILLLGPIALLALFAWLSDQRFRARTTRSRAIVGYAYLLVFLCYLFIVLLDPWVRVYWTANTFTHMVAALPFFVAGAVLVLLDRRSEEGYRSILIALLAITIIALTAATVTLVVLESSALKGACYFSY